MNLGSTKVLAELELGLRREVSEEGIVCWRQLVALRIRRMMRYYLLVSEKYHSALSDQESKLILLLVTKLVKLKTNYPVASVSDKAKDRM